MGRMHEDLTSLYAKLEYAFPESLEISHKAEQRPQLGDLAFFYESQGFVT